MKEQDLEQRRARLEVRRAGLSKEKLALFERRAYGFGKEPTATHQLGGSSRDTGGACLIPMQSGLPGRVPLFFAHPTGGDVLCYTELVHCLGAEQPFYGLQTRDLEGKDEPAKSLTEMAADYLAALSAVQPLGPYCFGGWSLGGVLAFELAQQVIRRGQRVAFLVLVDSYAPGIQEGWIGSQADLWRGFAENIGLPPDRIPSGEEALSSQTPESIFNGVVEALRLTASPFGGMSAGQIAQRFKVYRSNLVALDGYQPEIYPGEAILLRATKPVEGIEAPDDLGWRSWIAGKIQVYPVEAGHFTILRRPAADAIAHILVGYLNTAS